MLDRTTVDRPADVLPPLLSPPLLAVDRAVADLRLGNLVVVRENEQAGAVVLAAEGISPEALARLRQLSDGLPSLALTARRAGVLELAVSQADVVAMPLVPELDAGAVRELADPTRVPVAVLPLPLPATDAVPGSCEEAAVKLNKLARLLPAALVGRLNGTARLGLAEWAAERNLLLVGAADVLAYQEIAARSLYPVSEARVPLANAENTRIVAFRPADGGREHLAVIIGEPDATEPVLARLHSECFTGDLLGSLRCDCGAQLRGAIKEISRAGGGILLYLAQEGRGIGLVNKLRAYQLQDEGFDTVDANEQLGFEDDERVYLPAVEMLRRLGFERVRLMTNNPKKVAALARFGIDVVERVPHVFPANGHNEHYLRTKATRSGHLF
jgi:GTP cyclohydrolase II